MRACRHQWRPPLRDIEIADIYSTTVSSQTNAYWNQLYRNPKLLKAIEAILAFPFFFPPTYYLPSRDLH